MAKQADAQRLAAAGRAIEWHFAESEVADYMRGLFEQKGIPIIVVYTPWRR
jgi:hypothetical protein